MEIRRALRELHDEVDRRAGALAARHGERLHCRLGCTDCCVDDITVFPVEAERIRERHRELLERGAPHPPGRCAFLSEEGACRIYAERPYVCRTQGLPLRWHDEGPGGETVEYRDICPLNAEGPPLEELPDRDCWTLGPYEGRLAQLQHSSGHRADRVALRDLFRRPPG